MLRVQVDLTAVGTNYEGSGGEPGGLDMSWTAEAILRIPGVDDFLAEKVCVHQRNDSRTSNSPGRDIVDEHVIDATIDLSAISDFNLSSTPVYLDLTIASWENDDNDNCTADESGVNNDDVAAEATISVDLTNPIPDSDILDFREFVDRTVTIKLNDQQSEYSHYFEFRYRYTLIGNNPITDISFTDTNGSDIADACAGTTIRITALQAGNVQGGLFRWQRRPVTAGDNAWADFLNGGPTTDNFIDIPAQENYEYRVTLEEDRDATDGIGCLGYNANNPMWVTSSNPPTISPTVELEDLNISTSSSCTDADNGTVTFSGLNGTIPDGIAGFFLTLMQGEQVIQTRVFDFSELIIFEGLSAGNYELTAQIRLSNNNAASCSVIRNLAVGSVASPRLNNPVVNQPSCGTPTGAVDYGQASFGPSGGSISLVQNGVAIETRTFPNPLFEDVFHDLAPGDYTLIAERQGCTDEFDFTINEAVPLPTLSSQYLDTNNGSLSCRGEEALIKFTFENLPGGTNSSLVIQDELAPAEFFSLPAGITELNISRPAGTYTAFIDAALPNCTSNSLVLEITEPANSLSLTADNPQDPTSCDAASGSTDLIVTNGLAPYTYSVNGEDASSSPSTDVFEVPNLRAGNSTIVVTDANGCSAEIVVELDVTPGLLLSIDNFEGPACNGDNTGFINASATGAAPITIGLLQGSTLLTSGNSPQDFTNLLAGTYTVRATDGDGCTRDQTVELIDIGQPFVSEFNFFAVECAGDPGRANIVIAGKRYCRTDAGSFSPNNAPVFEYSTDGGANWTEATGFLAGFGADRCGELVNLQIELPVGDYTLELREATGCEILGSSRLLTTADFNVPEPFLAEVTNVTDVICSGADNGSLTITFSGGRPLYGSVLFRYNPDGSLEFVAEGPNLEEAGTFTFSNLPANENTSTSAIPNGGYALDVFDQAFPGGGEGICFQFVEGPFSIAEPDELIIDGYDELRGVTCDGTGGLLELTGVTGGTPPYQFSNDGFEYGDSPVLEADNLSLVYARDANGCVKSLQAEFSEVPNDLAATVEIIEAATCNTSARVRFTVTGGEAPYALTYTGNSGDFISIEDADGVYETGGFVSGLNILLVEDAGGCALSGEEEEFTIPAYVPLGATITARQDVSCFGEADGTLTFAATGGVPPYTFFPGGGQPPFTGTEFTLTGLAAGTAGLGFIDAVGCQFIVTDTVLVNDPLLTTSTSTLVNDACFGEPVGSVTITVNGGQPPYILTWLNTGENRTISAAGGNTVFTDLAFGEYAYEVVDNAGCSVIRDAGIGGAEQVVLALDEVTQPICSGSGVALGTISVSATGGTGTLSFQINSEPPTTNGTFSNLSEGTYSIIAIDANGCESDPEVIMIMNADGVAATGAGTQVQCFGQNSGAITVTTQSGQPPFSFQLVGGGPPQDEPTFDNLAAGNYSVIVTDDRGCSATITNIVIGSTDQLYAGTTSIETSCAVSSTGAITVNPTGGTSPYSFELNGATPTTTGVFSDLAAGEYTLSILDANDCVRDTMITVPSFPELELSLVIAQGAGCTVPGGATVSAAGGSGAFTYQWSSGESGATATMLMVGDNFVTVTDAAGCTDVLTVNTLQLEDPSLQLDAQTDATCITPGTATVSAIGGTPPYAFDWSSGETGPTATALPVGDNFVTVTDAGGCANFLTVTILQVEEPTIQLDAQTEATCIAPGTATVSAIGGTPPYAFDWSSGETGPIATALMVGENFATVTDAGGCTDVLTVTIFQLDGPGLQLDAQTEATCIAPGTATVSAIGGTPPYAFDWSSGETGPTATALMVGENFATVTDAGGCANFLTVTILQVEEPTIQLDAQTEATCIAPGTATVSANGGTPAYAFDWSSGETGPTATTLMVGENFATVTDAGGCTDVLTVTILQVDGPSLQLDAQTDASCITPGTATVSANGGTPPYAFDWSSGETGPTATALMVGDNFATVTDAGGCTDVLTVTILEPEEPSLQLDAQTNASCTTLGAATVSANEGTAPYVYNWSNGETGPAATALMAGENLVTVTDAGGCTDVLTVMILQLEGPTLQLNTQTDAGCTTPGTASVSASGGTEPYAYSWSNGETGPAATALMAGDNLVTVTDAGGCTFVLAVTTLQLENPTLSLESETDASCTTPGTATVSTSGGTEPYAYTWSNGETGPAATMLAAGDNFVTVTDGVGCSDVLTVAIDQLANPTIQRGTVNDASCGLANGGVTVDVSGGSGDLTYSWSEPGAPNSPNFTDLAAGTYGLTVTDALGCTVEQTFVVEGGTSVDLSTLVPSDTTICNNASLNLDLSAFASVAITGPGGFSSIALLPNLTEPGEYQLSATTTEGCTGETSFTLNLSTTFFAAEFVAPTDAVVDLPVVVLETSFPAPTMSLFTFDDPRVVGVDRLENQYRFQFPEPGDYAISLEAQFGYCTDRLTKLITIHADSTSIPGTVLGSEEILSLSVGPNPATDQFTATVELAIPQPVSMVLYDNNGGVVETQDIPSGGTTVSQVFQASGLNAGSYYLQARAGSDRKLATVIIVR